MRGAVSWSTTQPMSTTGANESMLVSTPCWLAMPAITRFELVPIRVTDQVTRDTVTVCAIPWR
jgi:hypothetical protein